MQTIGLLGGMSWESSSIYYQLLNEGVAARLGGLHSAQCVLSSVEFAQVTELQAAEQWDDVAAILASAARGVEAAGAEFLVMCTTSFHRVADQVADAIEIPLLHLADVVATRIKEQGLSTIALLGTEFTMSRKFFTDRLAGHDLAVLVPPRPSMPSSTGSSTRSWCTERSWTPPDAGWSVRSNSCGIPVRKASSWVVPNSSSWSSKQIQSCRSFPAPVCTSRPPSTEPWRELPDPHFPVASRPGSRPLTSRA